MGASFATKPLEKEQVEAQEKIPTASLKMSDLLLHSDETIGSWWKTVAPSFQTKTSFPGYLPGMVTFTTDDANKAGPLTFTHEQKSAKTIVKPILARDGHSLEYHMYVPESFYKTKAPLPLIFHMYGGGVTCNYSPENKRSQTRILANLGCVVIVFKGELRPKKELTEKTNPRINYKTFPEKLYDDIEDILSTLKKTKEDGGLWDVPYIQKETKVIYNGASFGGFMALKLATDPRMQKHFDGFISHAGCYDFAENLRNRSNGALQVHTVNQYDFLREREQITAQYTFYARENYLENEAYNRELSPLYHLKNLNKPFLTIQGVLDTRVTPNQVIRLHEKAMELDKDHFLRLHVVRKGNHQDSGDFKGYLGKQNAIFDFIKDVVDGTFIGKGQIELCISEVQEKALNRLSKKIKLRQLKRLVYSENPMLKTREGQWRQRIFNAYHDLKAHGESASPENLMKAWSLIPDLKKKKKLTPYLKHYLKDSIEDPYTIYNLTHQKRFGQKFKEFALLEAEKKNLSEEEKRKISFLDPMGIENIGVFSHSSLLATFNLKPVFKNPEKEIEATLELEVNHILNYPNSLLKNLTPMLSLIFRDITKKSCHSSEG